jgi:hypothetical protein
MLSLNAVRSEWVRREFFYAVRRQVRIIPIIVRPAEPPPEMQKHLTKLQTVTLWNRRRKGQQAHARTPELCSSAIRSTKPLDQRFREPLERLKLHF